MSFLSDFDVKGYSQMDPTKRGSVSVNNGTIRFNYQLTITGPVTQEKITSICNTSNLEITVTLND